MSHRSKKTLISLLSNDDSSRQSPLDQDEDSVNESGNNHLYAYSPVSHLAIGKSPQYGSFDVESSADSAAEDEEEKRLMPVRQSSEDDDYNHRTQSPTMSQPSRLPIITRRSISNLMPGAAKKPPPPPPPRRPAANVAPPPIPERKLNMIRTRSSGSIYSSPQSSSVSSLSHEVSPFESMTEISTIGCQNFWQHPFKPAGMCSNCLQVHE